MFAATAPAALITAIVAAAATGAAVDVAFAAFAAVSWLKFPLGVLFGVSCAVHRHAFATRVRVDNASISQVVGLDEGKI